MFELREGGYRDLPQDFYRGDRVYLYGPLGAGKTTAAKYFIEKALKVNAEVKSPTYAYWRECGEGVFHFDLYRLEDRAHFVRIGGEDVFGDPDSVCFVEWPEKVEADWPPTVTLRLEPDPGDPLLRKAEFRRLSYPPGRRPFRP